MTDSTGRADTGTSDATHRIETHATYENARRAVERLIEGGLPTEAVSISARGIRLIERLHPRGWLQAAGNGILSGATIGLFVGFLLGFFNLSAPAFSAFVLGFWGAVIGSIVGAATGLLVHAFHRKSERHTTERSLTADRFDVCVRETAMEDARRVLSRSDAQSLEAA